jgi:hypothetical protein
MPFKSETRILDGDPPLEVTTTQLPALRAFDLMVVLGRVMGPTLFQAVRLNDEMDVQELSPLVEGVFARLGNGDGRALIQQILSNTSVKAKDGTAVVLNGPGVIDAVFSGRLPNLMQAVRIALELNYGNFTDIISAALSIVGKSSSSTMKSKTSGQSGDSGKVAG